MWWKRAMDVAGAGIGLVATAPLLATTAAVVRWKLGSPVLFRQTRPGKDGKPFTIYKFRTMTDAVDDNGEPLPDDIRLTWLGRLLRASSIDELPELINVLEGTMSLVGPRPLLMEYLDRYEPWQMRRHEMRPGITGWAQVNGRNTLSWEEKFTHDVWYIENASPQLDVKIIALTILKLLKRDGISHAGSSTMPRYQGSARDPHDV